MKHIVETATDAATVCFFDPAALPDDFDAKSKDNPFDLMAALEKEGRFRLMETGGDGGYLFHFYVDEPVPDNVLSKSKGPVEAARFKVPSGSLWACGAQYAARNPLQGNEGTPGGGLAKFSHMGGRFELPKGEYAVTVWRAEWPDKVIQDAFKSPVGGKAPPSVKPWGILTLAFFLVSLIGTVVWVPLVFKAFSQRAMSSGLAWSWVLLIVSWGLCIYFMKKLTRAEKDPTRKAVEREFPNIVVQMRRLN